MRDTKTEQTWPRIYQEKQRSGQPVYRVDLGVVEGKRKRVPFPTLPKAQEFAEQSRIARASEGQAAFTLAMDVRLDAVKANAILAPHGVSILDAARYYEKHVLAYKKAPPIKEIIANFISDAVNSNVKPRYLEDLKSRLGMFASSYGNEKLADLELHRRTTR